MTNSPSTSTFSAQLAAALQSAPARPFVTFYDDRTGERVELSVTTYANWVAKTAGLVQDELDLERGGLVLVDLPTHWLGAVWLGAAWSGGQVVTTDRGLADEADLVVCGPEGVEEYADRADAVPVVALSLRPLGARFSRAVAYRGRGLRRRRARPARRLHAAGPADSAGRGVAGRRRARRARPSSSPRPPRHRWSRRAAACSPTSTRAPERGSRRCCRRCSPRVAPSGSPTPTRAAGRPGTTRSGRPLSCGPPAPRDRTQLPQLLRSNFSNPSAISLRTPNPVLVPGSSHSLPVPLWRATTSGRPSPVASPTDCSQS